MYCSKCGYELNENAKFCPRCGQAVGQQNEEKEKTRTGISAKNNNKTAAKKPHRVRNTLLFVLCLGIAVVIGFFVYKFAVPNKNDYLALVQNEEGKYGYINEEGEEVIACGYDIAYPFNSNGIAAVGQKTGSRYWRNLEVYDLYEWILIDTRGEVTASLSDYDIVISGGEFCDNGFLTVGKIVGTNEDSGGAVFEWGYVNEKGEEMLECRYFHGYDDVDMLTYGRWNADGLAAVFEDNSSRSVAINEEGEEVFSRGDKSPFYFEKSDLYLASVQTGTDEEGEPVYKYGYVDKTGEMVIDYQFDDGWDFSQNGMAVVEKDGKWGYIDESGKNVIPFQFEQAYNFTENGVAKVVTEGGEEGYINTNGEVIITVGQDIVYASPFMGDLAIIEEYDEDFSYGLINSEGNEVLPCEYSSIYSSGQENLMIVQEGGADEEKTYGCVNEKGKMVVPVQYDYIFGAGDNGWIAVGTKTGSLDSETEIYSVSYLNEAGEEVLELPSEYISGGVFVQVD